MRIAIVDDSALDVAQLEDCIEQYFAETGGRYETTIFENLRNFGSNFVPARNIFV